VIIFVFWFTGRRSLKFRSGFPKESKRRLCTMYIAGACLFTDRMLFILPWNQQCQITEGMQIRGIHKYLKRNNTKNLHCWDNLFRILSKNVSLLKTTRRAKVLRRYRRYCLESWCQCFPHVGWYAPGRVRSIKRYARLTSVWHLSVAYIGPKSRTERPRKTKIGTEVAHVTRDSDTTLNVKGQLAGGGAYRGGLPHSLFFL